MKIRAGGGSFRAAGCSPLLFLFMGNTNSMTAKLLIEHHWEFLSLKGGCTGSSESTLVKMPHCWKSHVTSIGISVTLSFVCKISHGNQKSYYYRIQHFEADFLWKVSLKILNSGIILNIFTHVLL